MSRLPEDLEPMRQQCLELSRQIRNMHRSISGINIPEQEHTTDLKRQWNYLIDQYVALAKTAGANEIYRNDFIWRD